MLYLAVWRCPYNTSLDEKSHALCYPIHGTFYRLEPFVSPYYQKYALPYVDVVRPYAEKGYAITQYQVERAAPVMRKASDLYSSHAHPYVLLGYSKLKTSCEPMVQKCNALYESHAQPVLDKGIEFSNAHITPSYRIVRSKSVAVYTNHLNPAYTVSRHYTLKAAQYFRNHIYPVLELFSKRVCRHIVDGSKYTWRVISPKVYSLYSTQIEPQVKKIIERVLPDTSSASTVIPTVASPTPAFTSAKSATSIVEITQSFEKSNFESTVEHTESQTDTSTRAPKDTTIIQPSKQSSSEKFNDAESSNEFAKSVRNEVPLDKKRARRRANSITNELSNWRKIVNKTTKDAFETFKADISNEKERLVVTSRPNFTKRLQRLQRLQKSGFNELKKLVSDMENAIVQYDDHDIDTEDIDFEWTPESVQAVFKHHAEKIRESALAVREYSQTFAQLAINRTEDIRTATLDILDEFSEVVLLKIEYKMITVDDDSAETVDFNGNSVKWNDWKEFRRLKEYLIQTRQDLLDFDIPMEDINIILRQAQETANVLAKEAAQYLSELKGRADTLFLTKIRKEEERTLRKGRPLPEQQLEYDDVIYYDEVDDDSQSEEQHILGASHGDRASHYTESENLAENSQQGENESEEDSAKDYSDE